MVLRELRRSGYDVTHTRVETAEALERALDAGALGRHHLRLRAAALRRAGGLRPGAAAGAGRAVPHRVRADWRGHRRGGDEGRRPRLPAQGPAEPAGPGRGPRAARGGAPGRAPEDAGAAPAVGPAGLAGACWPPAWPTRSTTRSPRHGQPGASPWRRRRGRDGRHRRGRTAGAARRPPRAPSASGTSSATSRSSPGRTRSSAARWTCTGCSTRRCGWRGTRSATAPGWSRTTARTRRCYGSEARLGQVFLNLLVNAAQAIPEGHATSTRSAW